MNKKSLGKLMKAPVNLIIEKIVAAKQKAARKAIWDLSRLKPEGPRNRRILDEATIEFSNDFIIGLPDIDRKHKIIIITYNNLVADANKFRRSKYCGRKLTERFLPLFTAISDHFSEEEAVMHALGYPNIAEHVYLHDTFMRDVLIMLDEVGEDRMGYEQLIFFVGAWVSGHILVSDRSFGDFYHARAAP